MPKLAVGGIRDLRSKTEEVQKKVLGPCQWFLCSYPIAPNCYNVLVLCSLRRKATQRWLTAELSKRQQSLPTQKPLRNLQLLKKNPLRRRITLPCPLQRTQPRPVVEYVCMLVIGFRINRTYITVDSRQVEQHHSSRLRPFSPLLRT